MIKLKETAYFENGETKENSIEFKSRPRLLKSLREKTPITSKTIYDLSKFNEAYFYHNDGIKRKLEIIDEGS